jgi:hypothetical protein
VRLAVKTEMPAPSQFATWKSGCTVSDMPDGVHSQQAWATHRVMGFLPGQTAPPVPLELVEPAFAEFQDSLQRPLRDGDVGDTEAQRASCALLLAMRDRHLSEDGRTAQLGRVITALGISVQTDGVVVAAAPDPSPTGSTRTRGAGTSSPREAPSAESPRSSTSARAGGGVVRTDGTGVAGPYNLVVVHVEGKLEKLPAYQNDAYAWKFSAYRRGARGCDPDVAYMPTAVVEAEPRTPCFLVDLYGGSMLAVRGAAIAGYALLTQPLGSCDLTSVPGSAGALQVARLLRALRAGVASISRRYMRLPNLPALSPVEDLPLSALIHPRVIAQVVQSAEPALRSLVVREAVAGGSLVFLCDATVPAGAADAGVGAGAVSGVGAAANSSSGAFPCILKFSRRYGTDAHRAAVAANAAPKMYAVADLPGGWVATLMEYLAPEEGWRHYGGSDAPAPEREAVRAAYQRALADHGAVHGDLRSVNILVRYRSEFAEFGCGAVTAVTSGLRELSLRVVSAGAGDAPLPQAVAASLSAPAAAYEVRFVDFEFAGTAGIARYPHDLNIDVNRPVPAGEILRDLPGALVTHAHDTALICEGEPSAFAALYWGSASKQGWRCGP